MVGFAGHMTIADDVVITGCSLVSASMKAPGSYSSGMPTVPTRAGGGAWWRICGGGPRKGAMMRKPITLDIEAIMRQLPHRYPFLLVDRVLECVPGEASRP
jgi:hypothetical protein